MARQSMLILAALVGAFFWTAAPAVRAGSDKDDQEYVWVVYSSDSPGGKIMGADYPTEERANIVAKIRRETLGLNDQHLYFNVSVKREPKNKSFQPGGGAKTDPGTSVGLPSVPRPSGKAKITIHVTKIVDGEPEQTSLDYETDSDWDGASKYYWEKIKAGYLVSWKGTGAWKNPKVMGASAASADPGGPYNPPSDIKVQPTKKSGTNEEAPKQKHWIAGTSWGGDIQSWSKDFNDWKSSTAILVTFNPDGKCYYMYGNENKAPSRLETTWRAEGKNVILVKFWGVSDIILPMPDPKTKESYGDWPRDTGEKCRIELRKDWGLKKHLYRGTGPAYDWIPSTDDSDYKRANP